MRIKPVDISIRNLYLMILIGFMCAAVGGLWDASYHFKYFRELYQIPHLLNAFGHALVTVTTVYLWCFEKGPARKGLAIMFGGMVIFGLAIIFDQWWHEMFGIDLTTWSPAHFSLYLGSIVTLIGGTCFIWRNNLHLKLPTIVQQTYLLICFFFILDTLWFPLMQQENGVIAQYWIDRGIQTYVTQELLLEFYKLNNSVYGDISSWVYGAWVALSMTYTFTLSKRFALPVYSMTMISGLFIILRILMNVIFYLVEYPMSAIPYFIIPIALLCDLLYHGLHRLPRLRELLPIAVIIGGIHILGLQNTAYPFHPPIAEYTWMWAIPAAFIGCFAAHKTYQYLFLPNEKHTPFAMLREAATWLRNMR